MAEGLSVSVVTYDLKATEFSSMLNSLNEAVFTIGTQNKADVTIIDNGDQCREIENIISRLKPGSLDCRIISGQGNIGYGSANNLAINTAKSRYHLILNPDVFIEKEAMREGLAYLESARTNNDQVSAISPLAVNQAGAIQCLCKRYPSVLILLLRGFAPVFVQQWFKKILDPYELRDRISPDAGEVVRNIPIISGCFMLCVTEALQKVGGFDERFFLHFEDCALSLELAKYGRLDHVPAMKIKHYGGNSARRGLKHILIFMRSGIKFFNLYGWKFV